MLFLIWLCIFICLLIPTLAIIKTKEKKVEKYISQSSRLIPDIQQINAKYAFDYMVNSEYIIVDKCNSKRAFDRYDYEWKVRWEIEKNKDLFESFLWKVRKNEELWKEYCAEYNKIDSFSTKEEIAKVTTFVNAVAKREKEIYQASKLVQPAVHFRIVYKISYTSPAGYNHYTDSRYFFEGDVRQILDDIASRNVPQKSDISKSKYKENIKSEFKKETCEKESGGFHSEEVTGSQKGTRFDGIKLSEEQELFISEAKKGKNILVDACIGSGKTTAIQRLCDELDSKKNILYLTYNTLLKIDAQEKIKCNNAKVTNYHGFAYGVLKRENISAGRTDSIQQFNLHKPCIPVFDVLILDEYQDIDQEIADMLEHIKAQNPKMQIVAVGDMDQKVYDKTTLDVKGFIDQFLGEHIKLSFTNCFRLSSNLARNLGDVWGKKIVGVNDNCIVEEMGVSQVVSFLSKQSPKDVLCLGARRGLLSQTLNFLESNFPEKYNKKTVYASISDTDSLNSSMANNDCAIFTTYDSCKGLERKICVVFDFTEPYWKVRSRNTMVSYQVLRNIFCVAASRGKERIVFVKGESPILSFKTLQTAVELPDRFQDVPISGMFDFKYAEDIDECFRLLDVQPLNRDLNATPIFVKSSDEMIDLSPCIGIYQEAAFFDNYSIDKDIFLAERFSSKKKSLLEIVRSLEGMTLEDKILRLVSLETKQDRYRTQVSLPFITKEQSQQIIDRLATQFQRDERVQAICSIRFGDEDGGQKFNAIGYLDVLKDNIVYELKFVTELQRTHFLQCACYVVAQGLDKGILWNVRDNTMYEIAIPDKKVFLDAVVKTVTKGKIPRYYAPKIILRTDLDRVNAHFSSGLQDNQQSKQIFSTVRSTNSKNASSLEYSVSEADRTSAKIAVIDTETNYRDEVMSIGVVVANAKTLRPVAHKYYIVSPEYTVGGIYSRFLAPAGDSAFLKDSREKVLQDIRDCLNENEVSSIFSYSPFDYNHLKELSDFCWYDIMKIASYKQYNRKIPDDAEICSTGRLKRNYKVSDIYKMLTGDSYYDETHNALQDAFDELKIMELLEIDIEKYEVASLNQKH